MYLHPREAVERFLLAHRDALALVWGNLDKAVPKTLAMYEDEFPDASKLPGDALCSGVRALLWKYCDSDEFAAASLSVVPRHSSKQLSDGLGTTVRVRRHPYSYKTGSRLGVSPPPIDTLFRADLSIDPLFGIDLSAAPYELAAFWIPNYRTKSLGSASLAAVAYLDDPSKTAIYHLEPLPQRDALTLGGPQSPPPPDDFDDFWSDAGTGDDPA
jgi:hypothetical protein